MDEHIWYIGRWENAEGKIQHQVIAMTLKQGPLIQARKLGQGMS